MTSNFRSHQNRKSYSQYKRSLHMETLEERALLSAVPLSASEYSDLRAQYAEFNLPENMVDVNVITLDLSQGDNLSSLKSAITQAGTTTKSDLIVVRTTNSKRILTYTAASNELTVNIDATKFGSITIVGLGPQKFTLDADMECRVMTVSGVNTIANFGGMIFSYGDSRNASNHDGGGILNYEATITVSNCGLGDNSADFGGAIVNGGNVILNNCEFGDNYAGQDGGAIYNYGDGIITVSNSIFSENEAKYSGGSILNIGTMTITDCTFSDSEAGVEGGAIANTGGTLTITDSKISENTADVGGGIYNSSRITITNCEISNNNAYGAGKFLSKYLGGGGIFAYFNSTTTINNSKILRNQALGRNGEGGGIDTYGMGDDGVKHPVTLIITNSVISNNFSTSDGGGICNGRGSTLTMTQSTISNNEAYDVNNHDCFGGGVINRERAVLTDCTISGNSSDAYGGGIANSQQSDLDEALTITNCTIANNTTWTAGGGIENRRTMKVTNSVIKGNTAKHYDDEEGCYVGAGGGVHGKGTFINCIIAENTAVNGGGFIELSYLSTFVNCTITKNTASNKGGGLHAYQVNVYNSIIVANTAGEGNDVFKYKNSGVFTGSNNMSTYQSWSGSGNIVHDGSRVNFVNFAKGDYRLASTSQAINKGSNTYANNAGLTSNSKDLYGTPRFEGTIDIGANEFHSVTYSSVVTTLEDSLVPNDNKWSLREAIYYAPIYNASGYPNITFANNLSGKIDLTSGQLEVLSALSIDGDGRIIIDGNQKSRVFNVKAGTSANPVVLNGLTIQNGNDVYGGGIVNSGVLNVKDCKISGNSAQTSGGGIYNPGTISIINSTLTGNSASNSGGGIHNDHGTATITNCTVSGNTSLGNLTGSNGGGISAFSSMVTVNNTIIVDNKGKDSGKDLFVVADNGTISGSNNLSSYFNWTSGSDNHSYDLTQPLFVNASKGDYRLAVGSQAINKGSNTYAADAGLTSSSMDLSSTRRLDGTIDIGAYEFQSGVTYSKEVTTLEDSFDLYDNEWSLREAISWAPVYCTEDYPTITFANNLSGKIELSRGELEVMSDLSIDGDNRIIIDGKHKSRVLYVNGGTEAKPVVLNGLTVQNGYGNLGGGIVNDGTLLVECCTISGNTSDNSGPGFRNQPQGTATIINCYLSGNSGRNGGGILNDGTLSVQYCTIEGNTASNYGGGIHNQSGSTTVVNCVIRENNASVNGGGISNHSVLTITDSQILNNVATAAGGGIFNYENGTLTVTGCKISGNTAYTSGGGINNNTGVLYLTNCLNTNNSANEYGGGIHNHYGTVAVTNSTISGNTASLNGGGISTYYGSYRVNNTIIAGNNSAKDVFIVADNGTISGSNNLSSYTTWSSGSSNRSYDSTKPLFVDAANGDYHLAAGSQAIDKGSNALAVNASGQALTSDLDNLARIMNSTVDMGAYEYRALAAPTLKEAVVKMTTVTFSWNGVPNASGYLFEYKANGDEDWTSETVDGTSFTFEGDLGMEYTARVKALGTGNYTDSVYSSEKNVSGLDIAATVEGKKVTVNWLDESPAADSVRYRVAGTTRWTTKKLKAGVTTLKFNATAGKDYEIQVLRDQSEANILEASAVVLDQAKLKADKKEVKDDTFQVNVTNYTAKNLAANAKQAIVTVNGVQTVVNIAGQHGAAALSNGGNVAFNNGLFTFTNMNSNTQYKVQVAFSDGKSVSTVSSKLSVKTLKAPYLSPVLKSATAMSSTTIQVEWEPSVGKGTSTPAQYYTVQYSLDGVHWKNATTRATGTSFTIMRLKANTQYLIAVVATKDQKFNASVPSNTKLVRTMA